MTSKVVFVVPIVLFVFAACTKKLTEPYHSELWQNCKGAIAYSPPHIKFTEADCACAETRLLADQAIEQQDLDAQKKIDSTPGAFSKILQSKLAEQSRSIDLGALYITYFDFCRSQRLGIGVIVNVESDCLRSLSDELALQQPPDKIQAICKCAETQFRESIGKDLAKIAEHSPLEITRTVEESSLSCAKKILDKK